MLELTPSQATPLARLFASGPGPMIGQHVVHTGYHQVLVDRYPDPRTFLCRSGGNLALAGDPGALRPDDLHAHIIDGIIDAPPAFEPLLRETFPSLLIWQRLVYALQGPPRCTIPGGFEVRPLSTADLPALENITDPETSWIWNTWGTAAGLAASGFAWAAFDGDRIASLACSFFVGEQFEDIGVITEKPYRRLGLSRACTGRLCEDIIRRGRLPSWTTSTSNLGSQHVALSTGFKLDREDILYVIGMEIPE